MCNQIFLVICPSLSHRNVLGDVVVWWTYAAAHFHTVSYHIHSLLTRLLYEDHLQITPFVVGIGVNTRFVTV